MGRRGVWIGLSLALAVGLSVLDVFLADAILITALAAPPLVAAARGGVRGTLLVSLVSLGLAVSLGIPDDVFATSPHAVRCAVVAGGALLAIWIAGLAERLSDSRDQLCAILEGVADAVVARDTSGRTVFANRAAVELLGFREERELLDWPGEPVTANLDVFTESGRQVSPEELPGRRAASGRPPGPVTLRLRSKDTTDDRWVVVKATPVAAEAGRPRMAIVIVEDVSEVKRHELRERLLAETGKLLQASLDYETTLRAAAQLTVPDVADWCLIDAVDERSVVRHVAMATADPDRLPALREARERYRPDPSARHGMLHAIRTGEASLYTDVNAEVLERSARDSEHLRALRELDMRSAMVIPMVARGRTLGVITLVTAESGRRFGQRDLALARQMADRMATALDNARLYGERSHIARALQDSLLPPSLPDIGGMEVAARFRAAGEGSEVGGDFYDLFETAPARWAVVIGDVCGKGADAAAVTALARYTLRTAAMHDSRPSAALATLNEAMLRQRHDEQFCTVAFASLQPGTDSARVTVASGGHPLPLLLRAGGEVARVGRPGTLLGVVDDPVLTDDSIEMRPGDALVLYTDGVTEARAPERIVSPDELEETLRGCVGLDAATIAERLEREAVRADREPRDDVAILVLRLRDPERLAEG